MSTEEAAVPHPTQVSVALVIDQRRLLVGRRPLTATLGGYAEFPGGKVESGESSKDAAKRECEEEAGIQVSVEEELNVAWQRYDDGEVEIHFFRCHVIGRTVPKKPYHWVPVERLTAYTFPPANAEVLKKVTRMLLT